ncbi:hypothetical protein SNE40_018351 [Patella caerulea]|uniref:Uncharacterized protein n=1 Tax=Patella caerulea TaxID=87958 RepID=A0AAN8J7H6_PATCE
MSAACISLQEQLDKPLLWSWWCRHHVGEVAVTHVFTDLKIETSKCPEVMLFVRLRKNWGMIPHDSSEELTRLDLTCFEGEALEVVLRLKEDVIKLFKSQESYKHDDYKEFIELCLVFLDEHRPNGG